MIRGDQSYRGVDRRSAERRDLPYVGVDRRRAPSAEHPAAPGDRQRVALLALVAAPLAGLLLAHERLTALGLAADVARLGAVVAVVASVLALVRWTTTGEAAAVLAGGALLAVGAGPVLLAPLAALLHTDPVLVALAPVVHALASLPALALFVRALRSPVVDSRLRPAGVVLGPTLVLLGTALVLVLVAPQMQGQMPLAAVAAVGGVTATAWGAVAVASVSAGPVTRVLPQVTLVVVLFALADVLRVLTVADPGRWALLAAGADLTGCVVAALSLWRGLSEVLRQGGSRDLQMLVQLHAAERQLRSRAQDDESRRHDVRATLAGVRAALAVSDRYGTTEPHEVHRAVVAELARIERLMGASQPEEPREVLLDDVLAPLLATERAQGVRLSADLGGVAVRTDPELLVRAVQNLLANARRHAPGSPVRLSARQEEDCVRLSVADDGPGVRPEHRDLVLVRGWRDARAGGQGLGLASAAQALEAVGGALHVEERPRGGATFVVVLPAATRTRGTA